MILIDALYINNSGGLELLKYLIEYLEKNSISAHYLIDKRCEYSFLLVPKERKSVLHASISSRLQFYKHHRDSYESVLCFGNIPPNISIDAKVYTYFHNINLLEIPKGISFKQRFVTKLKQVYLQYYKRNTDEWIVQTDNTKNALCKALNVDNNKILVLPFFRPVSYLKKQNIKRAGYIYVANYIKEKNHETLIHAWNKLSELGFNLTLHLTLSKIPPNLEELMKESIKSGTPIQNHGFVQKTELEKLYLKSKATVYPSINESLGLGIVEALQYGCDVIGSNLPFIHTICKPSAVFAPLEVDSIVKSVIDYETKKYIKSELLIKDNLPILHELLNKKFN